MKKDCIIRRMEEHRITKKITEFKHMGFRPRGRLELESENDVKQQLKAMKICRRKKQTKISNPWKRIIEQAKHS